MYTTLAVQEDVTHLAATAPQNILQDFGDNHCEVAHCQCFRPSESSTENFSSPGGGGGEESIKPIPQGLDGARMDGCVHQGGDTGDVVTRAPPELRASCAFPGAPPDPSNHSPKELVEQPLLILSSRPNRSLLKKAAREAGWQEAAASRGVCAAF